MSLGVADEESREIQISLPADVDWHMLDKSRFFFLGAALFSGVSAALYPAVVLKTRQQVNRAPIPCSRMALLMLRQEGHRAFYRGFGTSLMGTIPARALYMTALEVTKSNVGKGSVSLGLSEATAATLASAAGGLSASMAAQLVWTPVDVISQRLMVQKPCNQRGFSMATSNYKNGFDAFRKILQVDGVRGLYRGFGISALTYAPSSAVWWGSYSVAYRLIWDGIGCYKCKWKNDPKNCENGKILEPNPLCMVGVQGVSAAFASGVSALITMPLDTVKTRLQVLDVERGGGGRGGQLTVAQTVRDLVKEGGFAACYRGLGPRWASMSMSAATMVTTYELLKRLSTKQ